MFSVSLVKSSRIILLLLEILPCSEIVIGSRRQVLERCRAVAVLLFSDSSHEMSTQVAQDGKNQGLLVDGRRIHQEPGTTQATRRETRGLLSAVLHVVCHIICYITNLLLIHLCTYQH